MALFKDRADAGKKLAQELLNYSNLKNLLVLGLARGGVPVAFEVAKSLNAPMDVFWVRKLGVPGREELAMGAIASGGIKVMNEDLVKSLNISDERIEEVVEKEKEELERRERVYRGERSPPEIKNREIILVDDGLATGASMRAAVRAIKTKEPAQIVVAVPTAPSDTCEDFEDEVDDVVCAETPQPFFGVGQWYGDFSQTTDDEVREILEKANELLPSESEG